MKRIRFTFGFLLFTIAASAQLEPVATPADTAQKLVFVKVEEPPVYPGGVTAWRAYLQKTANLGEIARDIPTGKGRFEQTAQVRFIVNKDGSVRDATVLNDVRPSVRAEAIRLVLASGKWTPARQNGRNVNAWWVQPVTFVVE